MSQEIQSSWPRVAVGALVMRGDEVLLVKRRYPPAPNRWSVPGGHVEAGEELSEAVLRELKEETGIIGYDPSLIALIEYIAYDEFGKVKYHYVIIDYLIREFEGEVRPNYEVLSAGFFRLDDALELRLTVTTRKLLEHIRRGLKEGDVIHILYKEGVKKT